MPLRVASTRKMAARALGSTDRRHRCMAETTPVAYEWLMPLAPWEPADRLLTALESLAKQTWPARRLVVSVDGQLSDQLAVVLENAPLPVLVVQSSSWEGTGTTLATGLNACQCEWILRADADDRSVPQRAEIQLSHLIEHPYITVLGGQLGEITKGKYSVVQRSVPLSPKKIKRMMSWRNPINHPTVALNRQRALLAGSYRNILGFEDWDLWIRLNQKGKILANLSDILVIAEIDQEHLRRRHGINYAKLEFKFLIRCYRESLMPSWLVIMLVLTRLPWRVLPARWLASVMSILRSRTRSVSDHLKRL